MAKQNPPNPIAAAKSAAASLAALPSQIEIFRAGQHTDDAGTVHRFSEADVAGMASSYNPALREAPLTIGHPADNLPAYGWVSGLTIKAGNTLAMDTHQVQASFAELVNQKLYKKRSASFYPPAHANNPTPGKWYLRHVAFLGAQPPAVSGLADFASAPDSGCINFSSGAEPSAEAQAASMASPPPSPSPSLPNQPTEEQLMEQDLKAQLAAAQAKQAETDKALAESKATADAAAAQLAQFAEKAKTERTAGYVSFADAQIKAGVLLPKDKEAAVAVLNALADSQPVSFAEGGATKTLAPAQWLMDLIATRKPAVSFGEHAPAGGGQIAGMPGSAAGKTDAEIDAAAKAHMRANKRVNYAEALSAVTFTA